MSLTKRIRKCEGHTEHLLDLFLRTKEVYAFLEPMLFDQNVVSAFGAGHKVVGFETIRYSLFYTCVQNLAKIKSDNDDHSPSIKGIMSALEDDCLRAHLREKYSIWYIQIDHHSEDIQKQIRMTEPDKEQERRNQFDEIYIKLLGTWNSLQESAAFNAFKIIRDKLTAHSQLKLVGDEYKLTDLGELGLKWGDLKATLQEVQVIVDSLNLLVRNTSFDFSGKERQLQKSSLAFWNVDRG
ncbi:MAG: hypothetical protein ACOY5C_02735 [Pseudomonadota bacterium]